MNTVLANLEVSGPDGPLATKADAKLGHIYISRRGLATFSGVGHVYKTTLWIELKQLKLKPVLQAHRFPSDC